MDLQKSVTKIPLKIDFGKAKPKYPYPVRGGIPFPQGVIHNIDQINLLAKNVEKDSQIKVTATWPDGSIKWILIDCFATENEPLELVHGPTITRSLPSAAIELTTSVNEIEVDTSVLKLKIRKDGSGFLDDVWHHGNQVVDHNNNASRCHIMDFIHVNRTEYRSTQTVALPGKMDNSTIKIDTLKVEEDGPLHVVILMRGVFQYTHNSTSIKHVEQPGQCPFTIRIHCWQGSSMIGVNHFAAYEGDPDLDFVRQIGLGFITSRAKKPSTITWNETAGQLQECYQTMGLNQTSPDHFNIWQEDQSGAIKTTYTGFRSSGWLDISNESGGMAFGIRSFWQQYEKSLHVDLSTGRIDAWLWPPEAQTLDMRRYAREWGVGEDGAYDSGPMPENYHLAAKGTGKSHELLFYFHDGDVRQADIEGVYHAFNERPLLLVSPSYYANSRVFGHYHAYDDENFTTLETTIQRPIDYLMAAQQQSRWYGFFDYGDVQTCYATFHKHDRWENDFGRWGWGNGDQVGRLNYALMLQFLRTGERKIFEFAEANMWHVHDVDSTHSTDYPFKMGTEFRNLSGSAHRHNAQHWACPYVGSRGAHPMGARIHYFLTGSGRSLDILDEILALSHRIPEGAAHDGHGTSALSYLCAWERTGDETYRDKTLQILQDYELDKIRGGWMAMMSAAFGVFDALVEYTDLSDDTTFIPMIKDFANMCMTPDIESNWTYPGGYFRIYAEALRFAATTETPLDAETPKKETTNQMVDFYMEGIRKACVKLDVQMQDSAVYLPQPLWPAPPGHSGGAFPNFSIDANTLRDLPFLMEALSIQDQRSQQLK